MEGGCVHVGKRYTTMRLEPRLVEKADALAREKGLSRTRVIELALVNLLEPVVCPVRGRGPLADRQAALNRAKGL